MTGSRPSSDTDGVGEPFGRRLAKRGVASGAGAAPTVSGTCGSARSGGGLTICA